MALIAAPLIAVNLCRRRDFSFLRRRRRYVILSLIALLGAALWCFDVIRRRFMIGLDLLDLVSVYSSFISSVDSAVCAIWWIRMHLLLDWALHVVIALVCSYSLRPGRDPVIFRSLLTPHSLSLALDPLTHYSLLITHYSTLKATRCQTATSCAHGAVAQTTPRRKSYPTSPTPARK